MLPIISKVLGLIFVPVTIYVFSVVCEKQPEPYMDEVFHFSQAVKYFHGKYFEWDPKITTPPGLYIMSNGILGPLAKVTGMNFDTVMPFRAINLLFMLGNFYLIHQILVKLHPKETPEDMLVCSALNLVIYPLLYFYTFLYYTDCGSTFFILLMYLFHLNQHQWFAAIFGAAAILFRQTNIIWMFFIAAHPALQMLMTRNQKQRGMHPSVQKPTRARSSNFLKKLRVKINSQIQHWVPIISDIVYINLGYLMCAFGFIAFVIINKSFVLGDKSAHEVGFNIPQLFYFLLWCLAFASPSLITISNVKKFFSLFLKYTFVVLVAGMSAALCIKYLTYEHPYLLSDNRHYTFYLWKKLLNRNVYLSHLLIPAYVYSGWAMFYELRHKDVLWRTLFILCLSLQVVPQKLLELRYYNIPFIMYRLHTKVTSRTQLLCESLLFVVVNGVTIYMFLEKPFLWPGIDSSQRFMW